LGFPVARFSRMNRLLSVLGVCDAVRVKLKQIIPYINRNPKLVRSIPAWEVSNSSISDKKVSPV
jgi:hypothetical protein